MKHSALFFFTLLTISTGILLGQSEPRYRNASHFIGDQPLASERQLRESNEIVAYWSNDAQGNSHGRALIN